MAKPVNRTLHKFGLFLCAIVAEVGAFVALRHSLNASLNPNSCHTTVDKIPALMLILLGIALGGIGVWRAFRIKTAILSSVFLFLFIILSGAFTWLTLNLLTSWCM
jgi:hypothetical protein